MGIKLTKSDVKQAVKEIAAEHLQLKERITYAGDICVSLVWVDGFQEEELSNIYLDNPHPND